jgi:Pre-mRNA cleavage complex II protein Clp1
VRNRHIRAEARNMRIREYFYGAASQYFPHSFVVRFSDVKIYKIGAPALPDSLMPLGMKAGDQLTKLVSVTPSKGEQKCIVTAFKNALFHRHATVTSYPCCKHG